MHTAILFLVFCFYGSFASAQADWVLATQKQGIEVFVKAEAGSKIKALKLNCELDANISQVVALLLDIPATVNWMPHTKSCFITRQISAGELYYYTEVNLPWPLTNRDFVTHLLVLQDSDTKVVTIDAPAVPEPVAPRKGIIRIRQSKGRWIIKPLYKDRVQLEYDLMVDPGGSIPSSLINYFATDAAIEVIKNMQKIVSSPKYRDARLPFILTQ
jgi:hypothetical protein